MLKKKLAKSCCKMCEKPIQYNVKLIIIIYNTIHNINPSFKCHNYSSIN